MDSEERQVTRDDANGARIASALTAAVPGDIEALPCLPRGRACPGPRRLCLLGTPDARGRWDKPGGDSGCDSNDRNRAGCARRCEAARAIADAGSGYTASQAYPLRPPVRISSRTAQVAGAIPLPPVPDPDRESLLQRAV